MKQITSKDVWDTSECDLICKVSCEPEPDCTCGMATKFVSVVLLREVLKELEDYVQATENFDAIEWYLVKEAFSGVLEEKKDD